MAFSYTTTGNEAGASYAIIPEGEYDVTITKSTDKISKKGADMIELEIDTGKGKLWDYIVDGEYAGQRVRQILESAGKFRQGIQATSATFRGLRCRVKVKHELFNGEKRARIAYWIARPPVTPDNAASEQSNDLDEIPF